MSASFSEVIALIYQYFFPSLRIGAMFMSMPIIGSKLVPIKVRLLLAVLVTVSVAPMLPVVRVEADFSLQTLLYTFRELAIGFSIGLVFQLLFQIFSLSGQLMAMKMGLGFAMMNDPASGVQTTVVSQFFLMLAMLVFVSVDGHLYLISLVVDSFTIVPIGGISLNPESFLSLVRLGSWMFMTALVFSLPVLTSLLMVNIAFGVMSRAAPQLNIFAVGFPFTLVCGLLLIWLGLINFVDAFERSSQLAFEHIHEILANF